jgi:hypothetical protein
MKIHPPVFRPFHDVLRPWLGEVRVFSLPAHSSDIATMITGIKGCGFSWIQWRKGPIDSSRWSYFKRRIRGTGVHCSTCGEDIWILPKSHMTGGPYIYCICVRLNPSRLPDPSFFTGNWDTVLRVTDMLEAYACEAERTAKLKKGSPLATF